MRLATSLGFFAEKTDGGYTSSEESVRRCRAAGFKVLDARFSTSIRGKTELVKNNWVELIYNLRNEAEKLGVEFSQSHLVYVKGGDLKKHPPEFQELFHEMMKRSIIASSILGVKWAVLHPVEEKTVTEYNIEASIKKNFEYYTYAIDLARKNNVGIAFENMPETAVAKRRFTSHADELIALVDAFNDPMVGACWDFGHGNFLYRDQRIALCSLGSRLKATHVSDNYGTADDHMFPFHGNIDWPSIMPVLTEIGYRGDFTYEAFGEFFNLPDHIKDSVAKVAYQIGMYCLSLS